MFVDNSWMLPDGIEEILPEEAGRLEVLRRKVLDLCRCWGYRLVIPPLIEFIEPLLTGSGSELDLKTFKFVDQSSGRLLGIRADMTPQVARIDARYHSSRVPARLCYVGTVLHTRTDNLSRSRDPLQVGAELYGHLGVESDIEIIRLAVECLRACGFSEIHLDLGHVGVFRGLAQFAELDFRQESELFEILQRKAIPELEEFLAAHVRIEMVAEWLRALVFLNGDIGVVSEARKRFAEAPPKVKAALSEVSEIADRLAVLLPGANFHFDFAELRGYHYQTGIVFAAFVPGFGKEIARGGRYDDIGKAFGRARPATGFSADLKLMARLSHGFDISTSREVILAPAGDDFELDRAIARLRLEGRVVIQGFTGQEGDAATLGYSHELKYLNQSWTVLPAAMH
jgi:ATP phosphoribosyltransferase regulatory subunit